MTTLRISAGMTAARADVTRKKTARDTVREAEARIVAAYKAGNAAIERVHAAEQATAEVEAALAGARKSYATARENYESRFLDSLSPLAGSVRANLLAIANRLAEVTAPALDADAFATAHALPTPRIVASAKRIASVASELRRIANG